MQSLKKIIKRRKGKKQVGKQMGQQ